MLPDVVLDIKSDVMPDILELSTGTRGISLPVKAQPGASRNETAGVRQGRLVVKCTQIAEKGKANDSITQIIVKKLKIKKSQIELLSGMTNSEKTFLLTGITEAEIRERLE